MPEILSLLDVFVLTSHMEANPVSILEAMAAEKPVVGTRVGSVAETVLDGKTGYLVAPGATEELAARMIQLLGDPQQAAVMGRAGREHVVAHGSIERMVAGYQDLLGGHLPGEIGQGKRTGNRDQATGLGRQKASPSQQPRP